jgi:hypothetical protein
MWIFSNFQIMSVPIPDKFGIKYNTVEHYFQAMKSLDPTVRKRIASLPHPGAAKKYGRKIALREDWDNIKVKVMTHAVTFKFTKCEEHKEELLEVTPGTRIVEVNYWHDNYWGSCSCSRCGNNGRNILGGILIDIWKVFTKEDS